MVARRYQAHLAGVPGLVMWMTGVSSPVAALAYGR
jgi:hypothetical protein